MAPKRFKGSPASPPAKEEKTVTLSMTEFKAMFIGAARYGYVRAQHPHPEVFDQAVDRAIAEEITLDPIPTGTKMVS